MNSNARGRIKHQKVFYNKNPGCLSNRDFFMSFRIAHALHLPAKVGDLKLFLI
jgi:hypothetical protein